MRSILRQLLHDLCKVDRREKVSPRELSDHLNLFFLMFTIGKCAAP